MKKLIFELNLQYSIGFIKASDVAIRYFSVGCFGLGAATNAVKRITVGAFFTLQLFSS
jgi:hypothetical protein